MNGHSVHAVTSPVLFELSTLILPATNRPSCFYFLCISVHPCALSLSPDIDVPSAANIDGPSAADIDGPSAADIDGPSIAYALGTSYTDRH